MTLDDVIATVKRGGLGTPTVTEVHGAEVLQVGIDGESDTKARTLRSWLDLIDVVDMIAGRGYATDPIVRLNLRGRLPTGGMAIVVCPFDERTEMKEAELIETLIENRQPANLINRLAAMEEKPRRRRASRRGATR